MGDRERKFEKEVKSSRFNMHTIPLIVVATTIEMIRVIGAWASHSKLDLVSVHLFMLLGHSKKWDPGGVGYFFQTKRYLQFKQWDSGDYSLVHRKHSLDLRAICPYVTITQQYYLAFNLEAKVDFKGEG